MTESITAEAERIVNGPRQNDYGSPLLNHDRIAKRWSAILGRETTAEEVALCMLEVKLARLMQSPDHRDSLVDIVGYVLVYNKIREERKASETKWTGSTTNLPTKPDWLNTNLQPLNGKTWEAH